MRADSSINGLGAAMRTPTEKRTQPGFKRAFKE